jgi:hypothetical protein
MVRDVKFVKSGLQVVAVAVIKDAKSEGAYQLWLEGKFHTTERSLLDVWETRKAKSLETNGRSEFMIASSPERDNRVI